MPDFVHPLTALVIDFLCILMCVRLMFTRKGYVWIVPTLLSLVILGGSALCLFAEVHTGSPENIKVLSGYLSLYILGLSCIWMVVVIIIRTTLNSVLSQYTRDFRNIDEAEYIARRTASEKYIEHIEKSGKQVAASSSHTVSRPTVVFDPSLSFRDYYGEEVGTMPVRKTSFRKKNV